LTTKVAEATLHEVARRKAVVSANPDAMAEVERLVKTGQYASVSEFVRQAVSEKLARVRATRLAEQVDRYCATPDEDSDLIRRQSFPDDDA
jgi:Arc/MetJ-type ribon-helix-helix transcriptional regulator